MRKGREDVICQGASSVTCSERGSPRRAGGQGDVLSGCIAVFCSWALRHAEQSSEAAAGPSPEAAAGQDSGGSGRGGSSPLGLPPLVAGAYLACCVSRRAAEAAFRQKLRGMVANDVVESLPTAMEQMFPVGLEKW